MAEGNLVAPKLLRQSEKRLAAVPRTEKAGRLALVGRSIEFALYQMKIHPSAAAKFIKHSRIRQILYVAQPDVCSHNAYARLEDAALCSQQFHQGKRILATRHRNQNLVAVGKHAVIHHRLVEAALNLSSQQLFGR